MIEVWRPIAEAPGYEVSDLGEVGSWLPLRNFAKPPTERRLLKLAVDKNGYKKVVLQVGGKKLYRRVCCLVAEAWHGPRPDDAVVRHLDGSKDNDTPDNLQWGTPKENAEDMVTHGTRIYGVSVNTVKLSPQDVLEINESSERLGVLADRYGVTTGAIWHIKAGRTWKQLLKEKI